MGGDLPWLQWPQAGHFCHAMELQASDGSTEKYDVGDFGRARIVEDPWGVLFKQRDALAHQLGAKHDAWFAEASHTALPKCQHCGTRGKPRAVLCPTDLPNSSGIVAISSWACTLRALHVPHCQHCGSVTFAQASGPLPRVCDLRQRAAVGAPMAWSVKLQHCICCGHCVASDCLACPECGTTSPHGGYIVQPRLQRCARCGATVASDAGLCLSCCTANFRPPGFFRAGPKDLRLIECPTCEHLLAADALLCVHCGSTWQEKEMAMSDDGKQAVKYITVEEATCIE